MLLKTNLKEICQLHGHCLGMWWHCGNYENSFAKSNIKSCQILWGFWWIVKVSIFINFRAFCWKDWLSRGWNIEETALCIVTPPTMGLKDWFQGKQIRPNLKAFLNNETRTQFLSKSIFFLNMTHTRTQTVLKNHKVWMKSASINGFVSSSPWPKVSKVTSLEYCSSKGGG